MKNHSIDDEPLFNNDLNENKNVNHLSFEELKEKASILGHLKLLDFSFRIVSTFLIVIIILVGIDILVQKFWNIENTLIKELFDLLNYSMTTVLGYLFASKSFEK